MSQLLRVTIGPVLLQIILFVIDQESTVGKETQGQKEAIGEESDRSVECVSTGAMQTTGKDLENESQIADDGEREKSKRDGDKLVNEGEKAFFKCALYFACRKKKNYFTLLSLM